jgi:hypothetical protein
MYSITENIYYSQLSSVAILLQPEPISHRIIQGNDCVLSLCAIVLRSSPPSHVSTSNGQRSSQLFCVHYTITERHSKLQSDIPRVTVGWMQDNNVAKTTLKCTVTRTTLTAIVQFVIPLVTLLTSSNVMLCKNAFLNSVYSKE